MRFINWIKANKLTTLLFVIVLFLVKQTYFRYPYGPVGPLFSMNKSVVTSSDFGDTAGAPNMMRGGYYPAQEYAPTPEITNRMVVEESHLSLLVKEVSQTLTQIKGKTTQLGGYMLESSVDWPQESASGFITLRIPVTKLDEALAYFKTLSVKVVSENLKGTDVTDQFQDNEARLVILQRNKVRFEEIMGKAEKIEDILRVQQEVFSLQSQIDSIKGQQQYLLKTSETAKISVFLSTDELSLPYAPSQAWRPEVVFKHAVRSMLGKLQDLGTLIIWLAVYSVIWIPVLLVLIFIKKRFLK